MKRHIEPVRDASTSQAPINPERRRRRTPVDAIVGQRLREARLLAGFSQTELGDRIGVSFQAVQKYESGENRLSASRLLSVAEFLGRPVAFFFSDLAPREELVEPPGLTPEEIRLLRYYRAIPNAEVRDRLVKLVKSIGEADAPGASDDREERAP